MFLIGMVVPAVCLLGQSAKFETMHTASPRVPLWYALSLRSRYEKKAYQALFDEGVDAYLPLVEEMHIWSDRKKKVFEPLFRGYLFVRTDLRNRTKILKTDGVVRFVGAGNRPSPIPERQIDWVRIAARNPSKVSRESYLSTGQRVKVINGPFQGIEGMIMKVKGSTRLVLSLDCIAQSISVEIAPEMATKAS
jgi:transcription antitermination factor NusG